MFLPNPDEKIIGTKSLSKLKNDQKKIVGQRRVFVGSENRRKLLFPGAFFHFNSRRFFGGEAQVCWRTKKSPKTKIELQEFKKVNCRQGSKKLHRFKAQLGQVAKVGFQKTIYLPQNFLFRTFCVRTFLSSKMMSLQL